MMRIWKKMTVLSAISAVAIAGSAMADVYSTDIDVDWSTATTGLVASDAFALPELISIDSIELQVPSNRLMNKLRRVGQYRWRS